MYDVAYQRLKSSLHFGGFKVQAAFLGCRVGIYVLAISGCLGHRTRGQRVPTLCLLMPLKRDVGINGKKAACTSEIRGAGCFFGDVGWAFMPTRFQAALVHRTRGQQVPTLRLLRWGVWRSHERG